jgi:CubicO group peptidase (beta-lactamase class C family)
MRRLLPLTIAVSLSAGVFLHAADDLVLLRFSDYLDSLRQQAAIPGMAVTLVRPAVDVNWERAYGMQDQERSLATLPDTPFEFDGTTQLLTAALVLRCAEEGKITLDDRIDRYSSDSQEPGATIRQILSHTTAGPVGLDGLVFSYRPERLAMLVGVVGTCTGMPFRAAVGKFLDQAAMVDSIPGTDMLTLVPPDGGMTAAVLQRFTAVFNRLAKPYAVDSRGRSTLSQYTALSLTPASGLISTVRDFARFDTWVRRAVGGSSVGYLKPESLAVAWTPPLDRNGQRLPHGLGWFVQSYNGERVVWQFGVSDNASSSMVITVPGRGFTFILAANSSGLARPFPLAAGDVVVSPFARLFLSIFLR